ncbi:MAG: ATP-binding domain-containing protein, partial [Desulfovibrio sp.]|nr:ATP-binding domain-containing protein [Desulfovibrio sp.]
KQSLYKETGNAWETLPGIIIRQLRSQYRNTKQISEFSAQLLGEDREWITFAGGEGSKPERMDYTNGSDLVKKVASRIGELVHSGMPMNEIAVLYTRSIIGGLEKFPEILLRAIEERGVLCRWVTRDTFTKTVYDITTDSVTISTIYSVKGLDFSCVFLLGLDELEDTIHNRHLAYVGATRAREKLFVTIRKNIDNLFKRLPISSF